MSRPFICELFDAPNCQQYSKLNEDAKQKWLASDVSLSGVQVPAEVKPPKCYLCLSRLTEIHWFYAHICPRCGDASLKLRFMPFDLSGRRALVTGGRIKLGYQIALRLLRNGAEVLVTTRDWHDALRRYEQEPDYFLWAGRLHVLRCKFDLLNLDSDGCEKEQSCVGERGLLDELERELEVIWPDRRLDIVVHNAAQTICDPPDRATTDKSSSEAEPAPVDYSPHETQYPPIDWLSNPFPEVDKYGRHLDRRPTNTWGARFGAVPNLEAKQVLIVNAWAPFVLNQMLLPHLQLSEQACIIHVHAREGKFSAHKTLCHTHTNMAKAALSMMTRCLATAEATPTQLADYQHEWAKGLPWYKPNSKRSATGGGTYRPHRWFEQLSVHGVDPGWFSIDEYPLTTRKTKHLLAPPIDDIDGAARVLHPLFMQAPPFPGTWRNYIPSWY